MNKNNKRIESPNENKVRTVDLIVKYDGTKILHSINFFVKKSEFITILGPSGSGKTTLLKAIGGVLPEYSEISGDIFIDNVNVMYVPTEKRNIGIVFQEKALFPHYSVKKNIEFPLSQKKIIKRLREERIKKIMNKFKLNGLENKKPKKISGGEQQRVALARALVFDPELLLLDEPLSSLDKNLKDELLLEIRYIHKELGITIINVTHDQSEALSLSDRIAILKDGKIIQIGTPYEIYEFPNSLFIANFVGDSNSLEITDWTSVVGDKVDINFLNNHISIKKKFSLCGNQVHIFFRPECLKIHVEKSKSTIHFEGIIKDIIYKGNEKKFYFNTENGQRLEMKCNSSMYNNHRIGDKVILGIELKDIKIFVGGKSYEKIFFC